MLTPTLNSPRLEAISANPSSFGLLRLIPLFQKEARTWEGLATCPGCTPLAIGISTC